MIAGAIFDLDGVIVNTVPLHFKAWKQMFAEYGRDFSMDDYLAKVDGRPRLEGAAAILTELGPEEIRKAGDRKQEYYLQLLDREPVEIFKSTVKLINELAERKIKLAAASSSKNARQILEKIDLLKVFKVNVSGDDFVKGKPDPEIFLTAAKRLGLAPDKCVVFEDALSGVEAAVRGGFFCVAINRHGGAENFSGADLAVKDLEEVGVEDILRLGEERRNVGTL